MLTKSDFLQIQKIVQKETAKAIRKETRKIVREEVEVEAENTRTSLRAELKLFRMEIQKEVRELSDRVKNLEIGSQKLQKQIALLVKGFKRVEKKLDMTIDFFDKEHLRTLKRVERIEGHLKLPPLPSQL